MEAVDSMPKGRSPYGVHHMAGNVWELTQDWFSVNYYESLAGNETLNPQGPAQSYNPENASFHDEGTFYDNESYSFVCKAGKEAFDKALLLVKE